jgi:hypothetical protein
MKRLFFLGLLGLMACGESAPGEVSPIDTNATSIPQESAINPEDKRTIGGKHLDPFSDTFVVTEMINGKLIYEEPCGLALESYTIYCDAGGETPGHYINHNTYDKNY